jgi:hypothetical protein
MKDLVEHRFFERNIGNDLNALNHYIDKKYNELKDENWGILVPKDRPYDPGNHWLTFNVFNFENEGLNSIKSNVAEMTKEACSYYGIDYDKQKYYIHGWFNYYNTKRNIGLEPKDLHFHDHGNVPNTFHGYYCLNAEPSITYYKINGEIFKNINQNNRAVISKNGYPHAVGEWNQEFNRITIAYNITPLKGLDLTRKESKQFIPL